MISKQALIKAAWVGDEDDIPPSLSGSEGFEVTALSPEEAVDAEVDCVVCDSRAADPLRLVSLLRERNPDTPFVVVGSSGVRPADTDAVFDTVSRRGAWGNALVDVVRNAVAERTHTSYPVPDDEESRLEEVRSYAGLGTEADFATLTEVGKRHFDTDICFVGLVDTDREIFLSCKGASFSELPREETVCTYQILNDDVMVVENIPEDPRFENRETLLDLGMWFYAGAPLVTESGAHVGSFCVMDSDPRGFDEDDREMLSLFAKEATDKLNLLKEVRG